MLITVDTYFHPRVTGSLIGWVPKPGQTPCGVGTRNVLILSKCRIGASLALVGHTSSYGVTVKIPRQVYRYYYLFIHQSASHAMFSCRVS